MHQPIKTGITYELSELLGYGPGDLTGTKPVKLIINDRTYPVASWTELSKKFVGYLIENGDLTAAHLPLCPRTDKAFVSARPAHPTGARGQDGLFSQIAQGFYIDTKYNAHGHVQNIHRTLEKLMVRNKYHIQFVFGA